MNFFKTVMASINRDVNAKQVSAVLVLFALIVMGVVATSKEFKANFGEAYREAFYDSFKRSFTETCYGKNATDEVVRRCDCVLDKTLNQLSLKQLKQEAVVRKFVDDKMTFECRASS